MASFQPCVELVEWTHEEFPLSVCQTRCGYQVPTFQNAKKWWVCSPVRKKQKMKVLLGCTLKIWWLYCIMMHYSCNKAKEVQQLSSFGIFPEVAVSKKSVDCRLSDVWMCKCFSLNESAMLVEVIEEEEEVEDEDHEIETWLRSWSLLWVLSKGMNRNEGKMTWMKLNETNECEWTRIMNNNDIAWYSNW